MEVWIWIGLWTRVVVTSLMDWTPFSRLIWVLKRVMGPFYPGKDRLP